MNRMGEDLVGGDGTKSFWMEDVMWKTGDHLEGEG